MLDYAAYEEVFNSGDDAELVRRFFAEDTRMISSNGVREGARGMREFLAWAHDGVREVMRPQRVITGKDGDHDLLFAEVDMDFHATRHRPDFPFGEMYPGDQLTVKFFATYRTNAEDRIVELKTMAWPAGHGVTTLPKLGSHPSQVAAFRAFSSAFTHGDADRFPAFFTDDVELDIPSADVIRGKQAIVDFYDPMHRTVRERLEIEKLEASDELVSVDGISRFIGLSNSPEFVVAPLRQAEWIEVPVHIDYTLRDGLICKIKVTRLGEPRHGRG